MIISMNIQMIIQGLFAFSEMVVALYDMDMVKKMAILLMLEVRL